MRRPSAFVIFALLLVPVLARAQQQEHGLPVSAEPVLMLLPRATQPAPAGAGGISAAVRRVERATGGQVLNVESMRFQGREIHRVKVLAPGGRVMVVVDDPAQRRAPIGPSAFPSTRDDDTGRP
ncbi:hypothetical protein EBB59_05830 [Lysobacter pythonis]|uniref:PepSY domain-containing protein n=1 Tax=Solilutibacter pythonis TaxID=2483112 RepID=A0A3M2HYX4_9GAMM|nr:hypothetical protein [Lysobacter pythonis]RMH93395.1 hypothetical protein EBB59_05830 [Lysobacter pythonis]